MDLDCEFKMVYWDIDGTSRKFYTCTVKSVKITEPATIVKAFQGKHSKGKADKDVKALEVEDTVVNFLPKGLSQFFPKLKILRVINCGLLEISRQDLERLDELEALRVDKNVLTAIPDDLFEGKIKLTEVNFRNNLLTRVNSELLRPVKDTLKYADFRKNPGIDNIFYVGGAYTFGDMIKTMELINENKQKLTELEKLLAAKDQRLAVSETNLAATDKKLQAFMKTFKELQTSGTLAEPVVIHSKEFKAHKCIMAAQSSVFKEKFTNKANEVPVTIKRESNFSDEVLEDFVQFFYTQEIKNEDHAMDLLQISVEYNVTNLKDMCEEIVTTKLNLNAGNALEIYNTAHRQSFEKLKRAAFDLIMQIHPEIPEYLYDKPELVNANIQAKLDQHGNPPAVKKLRIGDE